MATCAEHNAFKGLQLDAVIITARNHHDVSLCTLHAVRGPHNFLTTAATTIASERSCVTCQAPAVQLEQLPVATPRPETADHTDPKPTTKTPNQATRGAPVRWPAAVARC